MNRNNCRTKNYFLVSVLIAGVLSLNSCMTMNDYNYTHIDANLSQGNFEGVQAELEANQSMIYSYHDEALVGLDRGAIYHYMGEYDLSNQNLSAAEALIEKYQATSITQSITSFFANDTFKDYAGEDYEDIYSNILMSLNYCHLGKYDEALVEIRRFDNKIKLLKQKYEKQVEDSRKQEAENGVAIEKVSIAFSDSALGRYLSMLLYRNDGDYDNAALDIKFAKQDFKTQASLYDFPVPQTLDEELAVSRKDCRLNVIAFHGKSPVKKENATRVYLPDGSAWYKLALPEMVDRKSEITSVMVTVKNLRNGKTYTKTLEKIESIANIAKDTFQQNYSVILAKSLFRSISHSVANSVFHEASDIAANDGNTGAALLFTFLDIAGKVHIEATERADVRCTRYFPESASVTGITVDCEDDYEVKISFMKGKTVLNEVVKTVPIKKGTLNLVEGTCLF